MDQDTWLNIGLVVVFVVIGGVFAGTEIALVSLRETQLRGLERRSRRGARTAAVARDPNRFLAAVQIGVTVAGFFSAAYGAATLAPDVVPALVALGVPESWADGVALTLMTLAIAYLSLVLGELVPKRLALQRSAGVAVAVAPPLDRFARLLRPVIWLLSVSTDAVVRLLGGDPRKTAEQVTEEELRDLVLAHESLAEDERRILTDVLDAGDRSLSAVMRPRRDVTFLPGGLSASRAVEIISAHPYSRYPVLGEDADDVLGFVHVRDLLGAPPDAPLVGFLREILHLPATNHLLPALSRMRREGVHIAVVVDEYGGTDGIVTLEDLVEELVGDIRDEHDVATPPPARTADGVLLVDAGLTIEEFAEQTGVTLADGPYETAAGYVLERLGRLAVVGDAVRVDGHVVRVAQVVDRRITRLDVRPVPPAPEPPAPEPPAPEPPAG